MCYDDEYPSCFETHATLRIFSDSISPREVSAVLAIDPSEAFNKGEPFGSRGLTRRQNGWLLSTQSEVSSRDGRRHLAWLLDKLAPNAHALQALKGRGAEIDISIYYVSSGQGGPTMSAGQMSVLGALGLDVWWDIYFDTSSRQAPG